LRINSSLRAAGIFEKIVSREVEEFWVAALNPSLELIAHQLLFRGTVDQCPVFPRDLIRYVCLKNASSFLICHNHPSGDCRPSLPDIRITKKILRVSRLIEVSLQDHIILGDEKYYSFADQGLLKKWTGFVSRNY